MKESSNFAEFAQSTTTLVAPHSASKNLNNEAPLRFHQPDVQHLVTWLQAARSFFLPHNHPFEESEQTEILTRSWSAETYIARSTLLRCTEHTLALIKRDTQPATELASVVGMFDEDATEGTLPVATASETNAATNRAFASLAETLGDLTTLCESLLKSDKVDFAAWATIGKIFTREVRRAEASSTLQSIARHNLAANLHPALLKLSENLLPDALAEDLKIVFAQLSLLLDRLRIVENLLRRDQPLKGTLPLFTLVREEARRLLKFIETRAMRIEDLDTTVFDALDSTSYAIQMELRKVFAHELVGLSALRQAPLIYAKVENAHGLLRDSFQQSIVTLAQSFDSKLDPARLFNIFQTKLEQSVLLRENLWALLQLVRQAEREREGQFVGPLLERLSGFRTGAMRYLMYKDWEAYERFVEETTLARGAIELAPVLHRLGAYLEILFGQINMRAVLAEHPFDYPETKA
ncbi:MAG: hypothetical protein H0V88_08470 [Pyrinomonadaceae bacterium]|nr:hypothetical protein [Pyrinomonadaceae bacterium]